MQMKRVGQTVSKYPTNVNEANGPMDRCWRKGYHLSIPADAPVTFPLAPGRWCKIGRCVGWPAISGNFRKSPRHLSRGHAASKHAMAPAKQFPRLIRKESTRHLPGICRWITDGSVDVFSWRGTSWSFTGHLQGIWGGLQMSLQEIQTVFPVKIRRASTWYLQGIYRASGDHLQMPLQDWHPVKIGQCPKNYNSALIVPGELPMHPQHVKIGR